MDQIIKHQLVKFYVNTVELNLLRKSNEQKMLYLLAAFDEGKAPSIKKLPLQIEAKDIKTSLQFADRCMEEVLQLISQKIDTVTNKDQLRKLVNKVTNQVTERVIDRSKAGLNKIMASYDVNQLHDKFVKAKLSPGEIQNKSKEQMSEVIKSLTQQLEKILLYKISLREIALNLPLSKQISYQNIALKYTVSDLLIYKKKVCQVRRLTLLEKLRDLEEFTPIKAYAAHSFTNKFRSKKDVAEKQEKQKLVKKIKQLEVKESKIQKQLVRVKFQSGEISEKKKEEIKKMQKEIQEFKQNHSKIKKLSQKISHAKFTVIEGVHGQIKVPNQLRLYTPEVVR